MEDTPYWTYVPNFVSNDLFEGLYEQLITLTKEYPVVVYGKTYPSRRISCVFCDQDVKPQPPARLFTYGNIPSYDWNESSVIQQLRDAVETYTEIKYDYCLAHIYRDGTDKIDRHSDKEGLHTIIASLSLGATRKFRFQRNGLSSGHEKEFDLAGGDLLLMKVGCQARYHHWVPQQKRVKTPRINLTFRKIDK